MHVWNGLAEVPADLRRSVVTLGNFDGVHRGHRAVLGQLVEQATSRDATSVAVTFEPHPLAVLFPERAPTPLTSLAQRLELLAGSGLDAVLVMEFTVEFARLTPEEFVEQVFVEALHAGAVIVGEDTRFGWKNSGNVDTLRELGASHDFDVIVLADLGDGERWSSTMARAQLAEGDVEGAAVVLGRPPSVCGTVVHGDHRGRELGFPTANLGPIVEGLVPADGVYAGWLVRLDLPEDDSFWRLFEHREARDIVGALSALGYRYDGMGGFADGRVPAPRDLSLAVGYAGLDRMRIRTWPGGDDLDRLYERAVVAADEWLADQAGDLSLGGMVDALGNRAADLADLWNAWGRVRPALLAT